MSRNFAESIRKRQIPYFSAWDAVFLETFWEETDIWRLWEKKNPRKLLFSVENDKKDVLGAMYSF